MIRIDSDTHFKPLDACADLGAKYAAQGPRRRISIDWLDHPTALLTSVGWC